MARPLRIEYPGALYHLTSRGDRREAIYEDDVDRERFLVVLAEVVERYHWICHAYCLMTNHYHLVVETVEGNRSQGMRHLNGVYTQASNQRHGRSGLAQPTLPEARRAQRRVKLTTVLPVTLTSRP